MDARRRTKGHPTTKKSSSAKRLEEFARVLRDCLKAKGMTRVELARKAGVSASAISNYTLERDMPDPSIVFAMEDALNVARGTLSQPLGFCACTENHRAPAFEEGVLADPNLKAEYKQLLLGIYRGLLAGSRPPDNH